MNARTIAAKLTKAYPTPHRLFGVKKSEYGGDEWARRRLAANILVSGSKDENAVAATEWIFANTSFEEMADARNHKRLFRLIADGIERPFNIRFAGRKTGYLLATMQRLVDEYGGKVPNDDAALRSFPGVAEHAAAVVRGLVFDEPTFGIDIHVRRIVKRMRLVKPTANDKTIARVFGDVKNPHKVSRAFVDFGKDVCGYTPSCNRCPFNKVGCDTKIVK